MAQEICDEIKRLQHRRQLKLSSVAATGAPRQPHQVDSDGSSSGSEADSPHHPHSRALFTFKQVTTSTNTRHLVDDCVLLIYDKSVIDFRFV